MEDIIIDIENLTFSYQTDEEKTKALDDVNIRIRRGEFLVILGHNGSGKSTLARLINGQHAPDAGRILVNGLDTANHENTWDIRKTCGMVFQNPDNQLVATIVEEDVAFGPENLGIPMPELRERVDRALELVEMSEYKMNSPALLSGGQKQRVAIAGILAMNPDCILLDEPTAMLDPIGRQEIMDTVRKLNSQEGKTIIHITHYMEEAIDADRIIVMNKGKNILEGSPREVFSQVEKMKELGLDVPQMTELAFLLRQDGFNIPKDVLSIEDMVESL